MKKIVLSTLLLTISLMSSSLASNVIKTKADTTKYNLKQYKNVILFIGDGMGTKHVDVGGIFKGGPLSFDVVNEKWTYHAYSNTDSRTSEGFALDTSKSLIDPKQNSTLYDGTPSPYSPEGSKLGTSGNITTYTDSAAGGSALTCGIKFTNSRIGMDIDETSVENLVEITKGLNKKAGVVTSDNIVGATPSDFLVHVGERHLSDDIIRGVAHSKADLVMAQNVEDYKNNQATYENLFKNQGFDISYNTSSLDIDSKRILGLFPGVMPKSDPRAPTLEELTVFALDYLDNEEGFFLMVEGSNIDKRSHSNQTKLMLDELLGFDAAVEAATNWADAREDTLIIVTADHETGALYYDEDATQDTIIEDIHWLSTNHSRARVDIAVYGDISDYIKEYGDNFEELEGLPYWDNTDIFKLCSSYLGVYK